MKEDLIVLSDLTYGSLANVQIMAGAIVSDDFFGLICSRSAIQWRGKIPKEQMPQLWWVY